MKQVFKKFVQSYLRFCVKVLFFKHNPIVILITGDNDCQEIKERLTQYLKGQVDVLMTPKKYDHNLGVAIGLLGLSVSKWSTVNWFGVLVDAISVAFFSAKLPRVIIADLKIEKAGDMDYYLKLVKPKIIIYTEINDLLRDEYFKLIDKLPEKGIVLFNENDITQQAVNYLGIHYKYYNSEKSLELEEIVKDYIMGKYAFSKIRE